MAPRRAVVGGSDRSVGSVEPGPSERRSPGAIPHWAYVVFLIRGTVALALGLTLLSSGANLSRLTTFIAVYWIVAALLTLHWVGTQGLVPHRRLSYVAGVLGLVVGVALVLRELFRSLLSAGAFLDFLGASAIATGTLRLMGMVHDDQLERDHPRRRYRVVVGTLELLLGIALVIADKGATGEIRLAVGVWGLATGTFLVLDALRMRRVTRPDPGSDT